MVTQGERLAKLEQWKEDLVPMLENLSEQLTHIEDQLTNGLTGKIKEIYGQLNRHLKVCEKRENRKEKKKDFWLYGIRAFMVGGTLALISIAISLWLI